MRFALAVFAVTGILSACASASVAPEGAFAAAGLTRDAYCALAPEARAELRRMAGIRVPLLACPAERARGSRRGRGDGAAGQD